MTTKKIKSYETKHQIFKLLENMSRIPQNSPIIKIDDIQIYTHINYLGDKKFRLYDLKTDRPTFYINAKFIYEFFKKRNKIDELLITLQKESLRGL